MIEDLQHDPRTKQQIKDMLYEFLYAPVQQRYQQQLHHIIIRNTQAIHSSHRSFMYKGTVYSMDGAPPIGKMNRLIPALQPDMDAYLAEVTQLNSKEVPYVLGFITQVLNASNHFPDYLRAFPSVLHPPLEKMMATCPCRNNQLSEDQLHSLQEKNQHSIDLLKQRVVTNLII